MHTVASVLLRQPIIGGVRNNREGQYAKHYSLKSIIKGDLPWTIKKLNSRTPAEADGIHLAFVKPKEKVVRKFFKYVESRTK